MLFLFNTVSTSDHNTLFNKVLGIEESASAWAEINDRNLEAGWYVLDVATNPNAPNENQAYGAGFLEVKYLVPSYLF